MSRRSLLAAAGAFTAVALAACTSQDSLAKQANAGDGKNYIAGDGSVSEFAPGDRSAPVEFSGKLFDGTPVNAADYRGSVTVINFWYAVCAPCRKEAPSLQALYTQFKSQGVKFLGVNVRDGQATAESFERDFNLGYPSVVDKDGGMQQALGHFIPLDAVPTTLVLDKQGRVSARILGGAEKGTLSALITTAVAEK